MNLYTISAFKHSAVLVSGVQNMTLNPGLSTLVNSGSGAVDPTFASIAQIQPELTFDTTAIKIALAGIGGISGAAMSSDKFWFQKMAADGLRAGATSHILVTMALGIIVPTQLQVSQGGAAVISYRAVPRSSDGSASPLAMTTAQSLEASQDLLTELYTLGAVSINGTALDGVNSVTLDFGIELDILTASGHVYPTAVSVMTRAPVFTITTFDADKFQTWSETGVAQGTTDSTVLLTDQTLGGGRGSAPITFGIDAGIISFESLGGSQGQKFAGSVKITPVDDGTADIIAISGIS